MLRHRVDRVAFVLYTDDAAAAEALAATLLGRFASAGVDVVDVLRADGARWFGLLVRRGDARVAARTTTAATRSGAQTVLDGRVTLESREELAATLVGTDLAALEAVGAAAGECRPPGPAPASGRGALGARRAAPRPRRHAGRPADATPRWAGWWPPAATSRCATSPGR